MPLPLNKRTQEKKQHFVLLDRVKAFFHDQPEEVKHELDAIAWKLEHDGYLNYPYGEKIKGKELFVIRMQNRNVRVFYVYSQYDIVFGIHAYEKKTESIPDCEMKQAERMLKLLKQQKVLYEKTPKRLD